MRIPWTLLALLVCGAGGSPQLVHSQTIYFYQRGYVAGGKGASTRLTDGALAAFSRAHPRIEVVTIGLPWTKEGDLKLRAAMLSRRRIDLFRVTNDQLPSYIPRRGELLSAVDPFLTEADREDFSPAALQAVTHGGRVMAWPLWSTALSLIANTEIMRERRIDPPPATRPWSWEEFLEALERGSFERPEGGRVWGLTVAARPPLFEWSPLLWAHAGPIFSSEAGADSALHLSPDLAPALERVARLRRIRVVSPSFGVDDQMAAQKQFRSGRATFILSSPGFVRALAALDFPYAILAPPTGALGRPITTGALGCFAVVAHGEDPARARAAHLLARYLTSAEIADAVPGWYLAAPARRSVKAFYADPAYAGLEAIARTAVYLNPPGGSGFFEQSVLPKLQAALIGALEPQDAIREIQRAYERRRLR